MGKGYSGGDLQFELRRGEYEYEEEKQVGRGGHMILVLISK